LALETRTSIGVSDFARDEQRGPVDGLRPILRSADPEGQRASTELAHSDAITPPPDFTLMTALAAMQVSPGSLATNRTEVVDLGR
jgi:hypothetical protein